MSITSNLSLNSISNVRQSFPDEKTAANAFQSAKKLLMQCGASGDSLFNHLSSIISKVIDEEPGATVVDHFEQFSERARHESFRIDENLLEEGYKEPDRLAFAQKILPQLVKRLTTPVEIKENAEINGKFRNLESDVEEEEDEILNESFLPKDLFELQSYWNLLGIGFSQEEIFMLKQSMSSIEQNPSYQTCRFWGKFFGLNNDYYVLECTLTVDAVEDRIVSN